MVTIFLSVFCFSILLSCVTLGISVSANKNNILYPFYLYVISFKAKRKQELLDDLDTQKKIMLQYNAIQITSEEHRKEVAQKLFELRSTVEILEKQLGSLYTWEKPVIVCHKCMPSVWGILLYVVLLFPISPIQLLLSIFVSCFINDVAFNKSFINIHR